MRLHRRPFPARATPCLPVLAPLLVSVGGLLLGNKTLHCGQRVGVQVRGDQAGVQGISLGGPAPGDALGIVQRGVGAQRIEFVPGQVVAGGQAQRGVGGVPALEQQVRIGACGGGLGGADAGAGGQGRAVGGDRK